MGIAFVRARPKRDQMTYAGYPSYQNTFLQVFQVEFTTADFTDAQLLNVGPGTSGPDGHGNTITIASNGDELANGSSPTGMFCNKVDVRRTEVPHVVDVYVTWQSTPWDSKTGTWRLTIECDAEETTENVFHYSDGTLITNVNGDIYPDGVPQTFYDERISLNFMTDAVEADALAGIRGMVNNEEIEFTVSGITRTFAAYTLLVKNVRWKTTYRKPDSSYFQFQVSIELLCRNAINPVSSNVIGWRPLLVSKGWRRFVGGVPQLDSDQRPIDLNSKVITDVIFLDDDGDQLDTTGGTTTAKFFPTTPKAMIKEGDIGTILSAITTSGEEGP